MTRDDEGKNVRLFDVRAIERNIRKGLITRKDYDKHLKTLPDVSDKIAPRDAPTSNVAPASRPAEHVPVIIAIPPPPGSEELNLGADVDDDEDDIEELDADDLKEEANGAGEEPPKA
jgi:hypothetical protein